MNVGLIIVLVIAAILIIWWLLSIASNPSPPLPPKIGPPPAIFTDMIVDFESYDSSLWMTNNRRTLNDQLYNSPYHYVVIESNGDIFYDNKPDKHKRDYMRYFETIMAVSSGSGYLVRDSCRNVAIRVCNDVPMYRVVHISSPNVY